MLSYSPNDFGNDLDYYRNLMSGLYLPNSNLNIQPFATNATLGGGSGGTLNYDIYGRRVAAIGSTGRVYHGSLSLKLYCSAFVVGGVAITNLQLGPATYNYTYLVEQRTIAAVDAEITQAREYQYQGSVFQLIQLVNASGGADFSYTIQAHFRGVMISY